MPGIKDGGARIRRLADEAERLRVALEAEAFMRVLADEQGRGETVLEAKPKPPKRVAKEK